MLPLQVEDLIEELSGGVSNSSNDSGIVEPSCLDTPAYCLWLKWWPIQYVILYVICALGALVNFIIIIVLAKSGIERAPDVYVIVLAIIDTIACLATMYTNALVFLPEELVGPWGCRISYWFVVYAKSTSSWTVLIIAFDRLVMIQFPFQSSHFKSVKVGLVVMCIQQLITFICLLPKSFFIVHDNFFSNVTQQYVNGCPVNPDIARKYFTIYALFETFFVTYITPIILNLLTNLAIGICLMQTRRARAHLGASEESKRSQQELQLTKALLTVSILYFLCVTPYALLLATNQTGYFSSSEHYTYLLVAYCLRYLESMEYFNNFFIFLTLSPKFRKTLAMRFVTKMKTPRRPSELTTRNVSTVSRVSIVRDSFAE